MTTVVILASIQELVLASSDHYDVVPPVVIQLNTLARWKAAIDGLVAVLAVAHAILSRKSRRREHELTDEHAQNLLDKSRDGTNTSPLDRVGCLSRLSYHWISPIIRLGKTRRLEIDDVPDLPRVDATATAASRFRAALSDELRRDAPSFLRVARRLYGWEIVMFAVWSTFNKLIGLASPLLIKFFLDWADQPKPNVEMGYVLAAMMVVRSILSAVSGTQYSLAWNRFDLRVRAGLISAIFDRSLSLSSVAKQRVGLGKMTNLVSVDVGRVVGMPGTLFDMFLIPGEIAVALILLSREVSYAFVTGIVVLAVMLPVQTLLGGKIQTVTRAMLQFRDQRVSAAAECLKSIRTMKLLAWVSVYLDKMAGFRQQEMGRLAVRKYLDALCVFFWASTPVIVQTSVFATVIFLGHDITAANAFTAISLLDRLIFPMNYFPWIINGFLEARVSALRIREFLFSAANDLDAYYNYTPPALMPPRSVRDQASDPVKLAAVITNGVFEWKSADQDAEADERLSSVAPLLGESSDSSIPFSLQVEQLQLRSNALYVVCGRVGAGKSSLLHALLGEMPRRQGKLLVRRARSSYAPQTPWLFRASVRQNITFCDDEVAVDEKRYSHILRACELDKDLKSRTEFDLVHVAEHGSNFSGGQRSRIGLARALYQQTGLYLLDDSLSGLDTNTARAVISSCFARTQSQDANSDANDSAWSDDGVFPRDSTVVLVTHSLHLLELFPHDTNVIFMDDGRVIETGVYSDLLASDSQFRGMVELIDKHHVEDKESEADVVDGTDEKEPDVDDQADDNKDAATKGSPGEEFREAWLVNWRVWKAYSNAVGLPLALLIIAAVTIMQVSRNGLDWWIALYTNGHHSISRHQFAYVLLGITEVNIVAVFFRSFLFAFGGLRAARATYGSLVKAVFATALSFFDATPTGRILNRLSGDTYTVDESLPFTLNIFVKDIADVIGALAILMYGNKLVLLLLIPLSYIYLKLQRDYRPTSRHVKRLDSIAQSPILGMFTETLDGLTVIRAAKLQHEYSVAYGQRLNVSQRMSFLGANTGAWFGLRLDMLGVSVTSFVVVFAVVDYHFSGGASASRNAGILGLTLTYALPIVSKINSLLNSFIDTERQMIAVERVTEYCDLPREEDVVASPEPRDAIVVQSSPAADWPAEGHIVVHNLDVRYESMASIGDHHHTVAALSEVSFAVRPGERVGICGRTGAGKTSLLNAFFRAVRWQHYGSIAIDGIMLDTVPLEELRKRLTYVPQETVLFSGSVRSNLDPSGQFDDAALWAALAKCGGLDVAVSRLSSGLDTLVEGNEGTFSKGQGQLLCIARALLRPSKVLCIDEATSSIDLATEQVIAKVIHSLLCSWWPIVH